MHGLTSRRRLSFASSSWGTALQVERAEDLRDRAKSPSRQSSATGRGFVCCEAEKNTSSRRVTLTSLLRGSTSVMVENGRTLIKTPRMPWIRKVKELRIEMSWPEISWIRDSHAWNAIGRGLLSKKNTRRTKLTGSFTGSRPFLQWLSVTYSTGRHL